MAVVYPKSAVGASAVQISSAVVTLSTGLLVIASPSNTVPVFVGNGNTVTAGTNSASGIPVSPGGSVFLPAGLLTSGLLASAYAIAASGSNTIYAIPDGDPRISAGSFATVAVTNTALTNFGAGEYETVAASQTAQVLGATGATGDYIAGLLIVPATTSPGNVLLLDNATSITVFAGGASSVSNLVPFFIPLGMISVSGAWKVTTGASVSVIAIGNFT